MPPVPPTGPASSKPCAPPAGRFDVLLVYRVDRFSRRLSDLLELLNELDEARVAFASAT